MNASDARKAHKILDDLIKGNMVLDEECEFLRSALPEQPRQMTLKEIHVMVNDYYTNESDAYGYLPVGGKHVRPWLNELRVQLYGLVRAQEDARESSPSLPEGMRLADHEQYGRVITSPKPNRHGVYDLLVPRPKFETGADWEYAHECELTFIDAEPAKPAHPEFLETEADYENAPEGTIVACEDSSPWYKSGPEWLSVDFCGAKDDKGMSRARRRVLRWGK